MSFATTAIAMQGVGVLTSAVGAYSAAQGQKSAMRSQASALQYQADVSDMNARLAELEAQTEITSGQRRQQAVFLRGAQIRSNQRATTAANGIDLRSDTALRNFVSTDLMTKVDALTVEENYVRAANNARLKKVSYENDARMKRAGASGTLAQADAINPGTIAFNSLVQGATSVAGNWYFMNKVGAFGGSAAPARPASSGGNVSVGSTYIPGYAR
jgi:hypothetical protein